MPKFVALSKVEGRTGAVYYPLTLGNAPEPPLKESQLRVKIHATSLNHRDLFIRQALYPGVGFGIPILADACGTVVSQAPGADTWLGKRVIINPGSGWERSPDGPEDPMGYHALGGTRPNPNGTLQESMVVDQSEVEEAPSHLTSVEAAALPLTGLTAWRAVMVKCGRQNLGPGRNILVTGIGGGVALMALKFAAASGANVYVTSGSEDKIQRALGLGAKGGVNYKDADWEKSLLKNHLNGQLLDAIVDGAGGDVVSKGVSLLKVSSSRRSIKGLLLTTITPPSLGESSRSTE